MSRSTDAIPFDRSPAEGFYLMYPFRSYGDDLIKLTLQFLISRGYVTMDECLVRLHPRDRRSFLRVFLSLTPKGQEGVTGTEAERFVLDGFDVESKRFYHFRNYVMDRLSKDVQVFKKRFVKKDLKTCGALDFIGWRTAWARRYARELRAALDVIDTHIDQLIDDRPHGLSDRLRDLGMNYLLLELETLRKLALLSEQGDFKFESELFSTFSEFGDGAFDPFISIGIAELDFESSSDVDLWDFGDGDFGGGGAGDDF